MLKLLIFIGATVGGWVGWWLGGPMGLMGEFMLSIVGTAVGMYVARRWGLRYFD